MTTDEKDAQLGRTIRELEDAEQTAAHLKVRAIELAEEHERTARLLRADVAIAAGAFLPPEPGDEPIAASVQLRRELLSVEAIGELAAE